VLQFAHLPNHIKEAFKQRHLHITLRSGMSARRLPVALIRLLHGSEIRYLQDPREPSGRACTSLHLSSTGTP
jgi:hypothetical protein